MAVPSPAVVLRASILRLLPTDGPPSDDPLQGSDRLFLGDEFGRSDVADGSSRAIRPLAELSFACNLVSCPADT